MENRYSLIYNAKILSFDSTMQALPENISFFYYHLIVIGQ